eukprot:m.61075 g.61075  ORF g.61075 m.61075 type:complete len:272 (+) comp22926_c1_seq1:203-1018(+)
MGSCCSHEKLSFGMICLNIVYNISLICTLILATVAVNTYQWIESNVEDMALAGVYPGYGVPGLLSVSCGLGTYCIDAAGSVSECSLPWPQYGESISDVPVPLWAYSIGCIAVGIAFVGIAWIYTFFACFGCFGRRTQKFMTNLVVAGGLFIMVALVLFGASFGDMAVNKCRSPNRNATFTSNPPCESWEATMPSSLIEGPGNQACRICPPNVGAFTMATSCKFGWGGILAISACVMAFVSSCCGYKIQPKLTADQRQRKQQIEYHTGSYEF